MSLAPTGTPGDRGRCRVWLQHALVEPRDDIGERCANVVHQHYAVHLRTEHNAGAARCEWQQFLDEVAHGRRQRRGREFVMVRRERSDGAVS